MSEEQNTTSQKDADTVENQTETTQASSGESTATQKESSKNNDKDSDSKTHSFKSIIEALGGISLARAVLGSLLESALAKFIDKAADAGHQYVTHPLEMEKLDKQHLHKLQEYLIEKIVAETTAESLHQRNQNQAKFINDEEIRKQINQYVFDKEKEINDYLSECLLEDKKKKRDNDLACSQRIRELCPLESEVLYNLQNGSQDIPIVLFHFEGDGCELKTKYNSQISEYLDKFISYWKRNFVEHKFHHLIQPDIWVQDIPLNEHTIGALSNLLQKKTIVLQNEYNTNGNMSMHYSEWNTLEPFQGRILIPSPSEVDKDMENGMVLTALPMLYPLLEFLCHHYNHSLDNIKLSKTFYEFNRFLPNRSCEKTLINIKLLKQSLSQRDTNSNDFNLHEQINTLLEDALNNGTTPYIIHNILPDIADLLQIKYIEEREVKFIDQLPFDDKWDFKINPKLSELFRKIDREDLAERLWSHTEKYFAKADWRILP